MEFKISKEHWTLEVCESEEECLRLSKEWFESAEALNV